MTISVVNQLHESKTVSMTTKVFPSKKLTDWGFPKMIAQRDLEKGFLVNDTLIVRVEVKVSQ